MDAFILDVEILIWINCQKDTLHWIRSIGMRRIGIGYTFWNWNLDGYSQWNHVIGAICRIGGIQDCQSRTIFFVY